MFVRRTLKNIKVVASKASAKVSWSIQRTLIWGGLLVEFAIVISKNSLNRKILSELMYVPTYTPT